MAKSQRPVGMDKLSSSVLREPGYMQSLSDERGRSFRTPYLIVDGRARVSSAGYRLSVRAFGRA